MAQSTSYDRKWVMGERADRMRLRQLLKIEHRWYGSA